MLKSTVIAVLATTVAGLVWDVKPEAAAVSV
jgi:hypothetical protein